MEVGVPEVQALADGVGVIILKDEHDKAQKEIDIEVEWKSQVLGVEVIEPLFHDSEHFEHLVLILEAVVKGLLGFFYEDVAHLVQKVPIVQEFNRGFYQNVRVTRHLFVFHHIQKVVLNDLVRIT